MLAKGIRGVAAIGNRMARLFWHSAFCLLQYVVNIWIPCPSMFDSKNYFYTLITHHRYIKGNNLITYCMIVPCLLLVCVVLPLTLCIWLCKQGYH